jgi:predicted PurR-regulated permease PerM
VSNDADDADGPDDAAPRPQGRRRLPMIHLRPRPTEREVTEEGIAARLAHQWAMVREERRGQPAPITGGTSNFSRAQVPWGVDLAAAWSWRFLVIAAAGWVLFRTIGLVSVVVLPVVIALLISALVIPLVDGLVRLGLPRGMSSLLVVLLMIVSVAALLTFAGQQVANGATDLANQTAAGLGEIKDWLKTGPLHASDSQINDYIERAQDAITERTQKGLKLSSVTEVGTAVGHIVAGLFIVLFSTYFFLADGERIWAWAVRIAPRAARRHVDSSGRVAWISLTQFVRATVIVAAVDAFGIALGAAIIGVPFVLAIGVLVFLGAFVPLIGATVAGTVAVLVALVDQGPITALVMLAIIIGVQQLEAHVLQPFLLGRWVSVHPLAVIIAIAVGVIIAGVAGALVAVPIVAAGNAVVQHLAANTDPGDDPVEDLEDDYEETRATVDVPTEAEHDD